MLLLTNPRNGEKYHNGNSFCQCFHGKKKSIITQSITKLLLSNRHIEDFFLSVERKQRQNRRICTIGKQLHSVNCTTIQSLFTAEMSDSEILFFNTNGVKSERLIRGSTLDVQKHYKETETFEYLNFYSCHSPGEY